MSVKQSKFNPINPELDELVQKHHRNPEALVDIFMELQAQRGGVTPTDITDIARALKIPPSSAFGIASFYSMINLQTIPAKFSEHEIRVCDGPVCWLAGSLELQKKSKGYLLKIQIGELPGQAVLVYVIVRQPRWLITTRLDP